MPNPRSWLTGIRLLVAACLVLTATGTALALGEPDPDQDRGPLAGEPEEEFPGLIDEGEYESPQFGVGITWTDAWAVGDASDPQVEHAIGGYFDNSVASDPEQGDIVFLVDTESESSVLSLGFSPDTEAIDPEMLLPVIEQESFLEDSLFLSDDAEILLVDTNSDTIAVLARDAAPNDEHVVYAMTVTDPGDEDYAFWVGLDLYDEGEYERILESIEDDIEVEGHDVFDVFGVDEILEAIESGPAPTEEPATEEPTEEPATEEPTEEAATEEPTEAPGTEEPTLQPLRPFPTEASATEAPTEQPATEEPTEQPATEEPTEEPATEEPTEQPATEEPTEQPATEEPTAEPTEDDIISPLATPEASPAASPQASPVADALPGLVGEGDYVSPQHDVPVTWTSAWTPDPDNPAAIASFESSGIDVVYLADTAGEGAIVFISIERPNPPFDAQTYLDGVTAPAYIESVLGLAPDSEVVFSDSNDTAVAAVYLDTSGETPFVSILEVRVIDDDTIVFVEVRADASAINEELLASVVDEIQVNGESSLILVNADDILAALPQD
jgi:hypothetical protein